MKNRKKVGFLIDFDANMKKLSKVPKIFPRVILKIMVCFSSSDT